MSVICCLVFAGDIENIYGAAPGTPPPSPFFYPDSLWQQVNTCPVPAGEANMGIFYDNGTLWHVINTTNQPFVVYHIDTLGNTLSQFSYSGMAYALGVCRVRDSLFIGQFYPTPERILVFDTAGNFARQISLSNSGACRGIDYDPNTGYLWVFGATAANNVRVNICTRTGTVRKSIPITGGYWSFDGCIDWRYYPNRVWYGDQQNNRDHYCRVDTAAGTGAILARFANPGNNYPEGITYCEQSGTGFCWVTAYASSVAYKMKVHDVSIEEGTAPHIKQSLFSIAPNPSRAGNIVFSLPKDRSAKVNIYNAAGVKVGTLIGKDHIVWRSDLRTGVYFCEMEASGLKVTRGLIIVK